MYKIQGRIRQILHIFPNNVRGFMGKGAGIARIFTSVLYILTKSPESIYSNL